MSTAFLNSGAPATLAPASNQRQPGTYSSSHPSVLVGLLIAAALIALSALLGLLFTSAVFGYPGSLG